MSVQAISAALLLSAVTPGERLAAFALASYANPGQRAWPSNPVAAARAGLSRSQYLAARDGLARRGLVRVEDQGGGRSRSSTIALDFAAAGPWYDGWVNPRALEAALGHSAARGPARQLLVVLASVADDGGVVASLTVEEIRALAGLADSTYRRARAALLRAHEVTVDGAGGHGCLNRWVLCGQGSEPPARAARPVRVPPPPGARPLVAQVTPRGDPACAGSPALAEKGLVPGGVLASNSPGGVLDANRPVAGGVSPANGPDAGGISLRTPPPTPPETPPPHVRACKERRNQESGTSPPTPRPGGSPLRHITIVEDFISERGRRRQRHVTVDLDDVHAELREPQAHDIDRWQRIRADLCRNVGETTFAIWLDALTLGAVDHHGALVLSCPSPPRKWVITRFARVFDRVGSAHGRRVQLADDRQQQFLDALAAARAQQPIDVHIHKEAS
ncbi:MAG: hypothetical protein ACRDL8_00360 [Solirubrobacteraceae bacterium]